MRYLNQLEPDALVENFLVNPPVNFMTWLIDNKVPAFSAKFDLLTTADHAFRRKIQKLPFYKKWCQLLHLQTCFVGTTVSEYALLADGVDADSLAASIKQQVVGNFPLSVVKDLPNNSPLHDQRVSSYSQAFVNALKKNGFIEVQGQALAWVNIDYKDIDDYLSRLSYSRRKDLRRKLRSRKELDIRLLHAGDACFFDQAVLDNYYQLYLNVYEQSEIHFDLLSKGFFSRLLMDSYSGAKIFAYYHQEKLIGYNICFVVNDVLVDKYVGFSYPAAREFNLYYVSWFHNLDYAKQQGLKRYIAGWTDPQVKAYLGAQFTFTRHMVYIRNRVLRAILRRFSTRFESDQRWQDSLLIVRRSK